MTRRGCLPIRHGDVLLGFLWVIVGERPLSDPERAGLQRGGEEVAANLWARHRAADERRRRTNELLENLFARHGLAPRDLAATLRWPEHGSYAVVVCEGDEAVAEKLRRSRAAYDVAYLEDAGRLTILVRDPSHVQQALNVRNGGVELALYLPRRRRTRTRSGGDRRAGRPRAALVRPCGGLRRARQLGADRLALDQRPPPAAARADRRPRPAPARRSAPRGARGPARARRRRRRRGQGAEHAPRDALPPPAAGGGDHRPRPGEGRRPAARPPRPAPAPAERDSCRTSAAITATEPLWDALPAGNEDSRHGRNDPGTHGGPRGSDRADRHRSRHQDAPSTCRFGGSGRAAHARADDARPRAARGALPLRRRPSGVRHARRRHPPPARAARRGRGFAASPAAPPASPAARSRAARSRRSPPRASTRWPSASSSAPTPRTRCPRSPASGRTASTPPSTCSARRRSPRPRPITTCSAARTPSARWRRPPSSTPTAT